MGPMGKIPELGVVYNVVLVVGASIIVKTRRHSPRIPVRDRHRLLGAAGGGAVDGSCWGIEINGSRPPAVVTHGERELIANLITAGGRLTSRGGIDKG